MESNEDLMDVKLTLAYVDEEMFTLFDGEEFTSFDMWVHDTVVVLYDAGKRRISPKMVYRGMFGKKAHDNTDAAALEKITRSLEKCRRTVAYIDFYKIGGTPKKIIRDRTLSVDDFILPCGVWELSTEEKDVKIYELYSDSLFHEYEKVLMHCLTPPINIGLRKH